MCKRDEIPIQQVDIKTLGKLLRLYEESLDNTIADSRFISLKINVKKKVTAAYGR